MHLLKLPTPSKPSYQTGPKRANPADKRCKKRRAEPFAPGHIYDANRAYTPVMTTIGEWRPSQIRPASYWLPDLSPPSSLWNPTAYPCDACVGGFRR
jgi:hypothetical protein